MASRPLCCVSLLRPSSFAFKGFLTAQSSSFLPPLHYYISRSRRQSTTPATTAFVHFHQLSATNRLNSSIPTSPSKLQDALRSCCRPRRRRRRLIASSVRRFLGQQQQRFPSVVLGGPSLLCPSIIVRGSRLHHRGRDRIHDVLPKGDRDHPQRRDLHRNRGDDPDHHQLPRRLHNHPPGKLLLLRCRSQHHSDKLAILGRASLPVGQRHHPSMEHCCPK